MTPRNTVLIVADPTDAVAAQVTDALRSNGFDVLDTTASALLGKAITYISENGSTMWASTVTQAGVDRTITSGELAAVFNRATQLNPTGFANNDDESYATSERAALYGALIESLDVPVLNRPQGTTLSGPPYLAIEWMAMAVRAGLTVCGLSWTSEGVEVEAVGGYLGSVTVVGPHALPSDDVGPVAEWSSRFGAQSLRLAASLGCELLRIELGTLIDGTVVVTQVDPRPVQLEPMTILGVARHLAAGLVPIAQLRAAS